MLISNINEVVRKGDILYHCGDVAWSSFSVREGFFNRLLCKNIHLVLGNHDDPKRFRVGPGLHGLSWVGEYKEIHPEVGHKVVLFHYPLRSWNGKGHGAIHLFGHCHGKLPEWDRSLDCGVDAGRRYRPWEWEEIREHFKEVPYFQDGDTDSHRR